MRVVTWFASAAAGLVTTISWLIVSLIVVSSEHVTRPCKLTRRSPLPKEAQVRVRSRYPRYPRINFDGTLVYEVDIYENQQYYSTMGWTRRCTDHPSWSNADGTKQCSMDDIDVPPRGWEWQNDWTVDIDSLITDTDGWSYSNSFGQQALAISGCFSNDYDGLCVRQRRHVRVITKSHC